MHREEVDMITIRKVAVEAGADYRSVAKFVRGEPVRGHYVRARIVEALKAHGIEPQAVEVTKG